MGMAPVTTVTINTSIPGHRLLRYESRIVTGGPGPFEANGSRPDTTVSDLTVSQRVFGDAGGSRGVSITGTTIFWGGDGHNHWHITDMESGTLTRLGNGNAVGTLAKHGFLIHDGFLYNGSLPGSLRSRDELPVGRHHRPAEREVPARSGSEYLGMVPRERHHEQHRMGGPQDQEGQGEPVVARWGV